MVSPVYIICCESGSDDSFTGLTSLFNVIDRLVIRDAPLEASQQGIPHYGFPSIRIVAVWRADAAEDFEGEFDSEMRLIAKPGNDVKTIFLQSFRFLPDKNKHRTTAIIGALDLRACESLQVESRIRRAGDSDWLTQRYVIDVKVEMPTPLETASQE